MWNILKYKKNNFLKKSNQISSRKGNFEIQKITKF